MTRGYINSHARIKVNPLEPGLFGGWDMKQQIAGTVFDKSGNGYDFYLQNAPSQRSTLMGDCLKFNGVNQGCKSTSQPITGYPFTMANWVNVADGAGAGEIFNLLDESVTNTAYGISLDAAGHLRSRAATASGSDYGASTVDVRGTWAHAVVVFVSATERILYVNGEYDNTATTSRLFGAGTDIMSLGYRADAPSPSDYLDGCILGPQVINEAKDAAWVSQQYALGKTALFQTLPVNNTGTVTSGNIGDSPFVVDSREFAVVDEPDPDTFKPNTVLNSDFALWTDPTVPDDWTKDGTHDASNYVEANANGMRFVSTGGAYMAVETDAIETGKLVVINIGVHSLTGSFKVSDGIPGGLEWVITGSTQIIIPSPAAGTMLTIARNSGVACDAVISLVTAQQFTSYMKAIECITSGVCYVPTSLFQQSPKEVARGHLEFWCYKASTASDINVQFIGETKGGTYSAGQYGYALSFNTNDRIVLREVANGVASNLMYTAVGTVPIAQWFKIKIDMSSITGFGIYLNDSLVTAAFGTNPILDTTYTESMYITVDKDAGDKVAIGSLNGNHSIIKRLLP